MERARRGAVAVLVAAVAALDATAGFAWPHQGDELWPGVIYRRIEGPVALPGTGALKQVVHVVYADTWNDGVSFVAPRPADRNLTVSEFAELYRADVAVNANYFDVDRVACGLAVGEGELWSDAYHHLPWGRCSDSVGFTDSNEVVFFDSYDRLTGPLPPGVDTVVTGMPTLVRDGVAIEPSALRSSDYPPNMATRNPRTAICMHDDGRTFVMVVVEGRAPLQGRAGMTGIVLARFLRDVVGCRTAVALDGGGSSAMFVQGMTGHDDQTPGVVSRIASGDERRLGTHLGIRGDDCGSPWSADVVDQSTSPRVAAGESFDLWVRYRNTGVRTWRPDGRWPVVLTTDEPEEHLSLLFLEDAWISPMRPTLVEEVTPSGAIGTFVFRAVAPTEPGVYPLVVSPLAEGARRILAPAVRWEVVVDPPDACAPR